MAIGRSNASGGGTGGKLTVHAPVGVTVTAEKGGRIYTRTANAQGIAVFNGLKTGFWAVTISDGVQNPTTQYIEITADYEMTIAFFAAYIDATWPAGSTCICQKGNVTLVAPSGSAGSYMFVVTEAGDWTVSCTDGTDTASQTVTITEDGQVETVNLAYFLKITDFDWDSFGVLGEDYELVHDDDTPIDPSEYAATENWKARLLKSSSLIPLKDCKIDVFALGAGGSAAANAAGNGGAAGGAGYTRTGYGIDITSGTEYPIIVGEGVLSNAGANGRDGIKGNDTSAFGIIASGGFPGLYSGLGGNGGSGGTGWGSAGEGGKNGEDGAVGSKSTYLGGKGQKNEPGPNGETGNTQEFGTGRVYAEGGKSSGTTNAAHNTGNGGNAKGTDLLSGSGIVVIRPAHPFTITVSYPEGDECTCTNGDTTLSAPDTSGNVVFTVRDYGNWTVSCNNGLQGEEYRESSRSVTIDMYHGSETVALAYIFRLVADGVVASGFAMAASAESSNQLFEQKDGYLYLYSSKSSYPILGYFSPQVSGYSTMRITAEVGGTATLPTIIAGVKNDTNADTTFISSIAIPADGTEKTEYFIDLSHAASPYYVAIYLAGGSSYPKSLNIYDIELE